MKFSDIKKGMELTNGEEVVTVLSEPRFSFVFDCMLVEVTSHSNGQFDTILEKEVKFYRKAYYDNWEVYNA